MLPDSNQAITAIGERYRHNCEKPTDRQLLQEFRALQCSNLDSVFRAIGQRIQRLPAILSCRIKRTDSIIRKLRRENAMDLVRMDDIVGFRIIAPSVAAQRQIIEALTLENPAVHRVRDYLNQPKKTGYRAVHVVLRQEIRIAESKTVRQYPYEIQIRTHYQQLWATLSESFGEQVKEGGGTEEQRAYLAEVAELACDIEKQEDLVQFEDLHPSAGLSFFLVDFDKKSAMTVRVSPFGVELNTAIKEAVYLEELYRQDLGRETVLLGVPTGPSELKFTHPRYYEPQGIPELPDALIPRLPRPK